MDKVTGKISDKQSVSGKMQMPSRAVSDYNLLTNKPSIEEITLVGNKNLSDFGDRSVTNIEIQNIIDSVFNS